MAENSKKDSENSKLAINKSAIINELQELIESSLSNSASLNEIPKIKKLLDELQNEVTTDTSEIKKLAEENSLLRNQINKGGNYDLQFQMLFENCEDAILIVNDKSRFVNANRSASNLFKISKGELIGKYFWEINSSYDESEFKIKWKLFLESGKDSSNFLVIDKEGNQTAVEYSAIANFSPGMHLIMMKDVSEKKKLEDILKNSDQHFRSVWNSSNDGMRLIDQEGIILEVNNAYCKMVGKSKEELENKEATVVNKNEDKERIQAAIISNFKNDRIGIKIEKKITLWDDREVWFEITNSYLNLENKKYLLSQFRDVTNEKKLEQNLQESENRLRELINLMPDIVCFKDGDGKWLEANKNDLKLFQLENIDYHGKKDSDLALFSPFYYDAFRNCEASDNLTWEKGSETRCEEIIPTPNGESIIFDIIKKPSFDSNGNRKGLLVIGRDITDRKIAENYLIESKKKLERMMSNLPGIVYRCIDDEKWTMKFISDGCLRLTGYKPEELINNSTLSYEDTIYEEDKPLVRNTVKANLEKEEPFVLEYRIVDKNKNIKWVYEKGGLVKDVSSGDMFLEGIIIDITDRKNVEQELKKSESRLSVFYEAAFSGILIHNKGKVVDCNKGICEMLGYSRSEFLGLNGLDILVPIEEKQKVLEIIKSNSSESYDTIIKKKDGNLISVRVQGTSIDYLGEKVRFVEFIDISFQKRIENMNKARLRLLEYSNNYPMEQLLQATLDEVEKLTDSKIGFYHFVSNNESSLTLQAWSTNTLNALCKTEGKGRHYDVDLAGVWVDAIKQRKAVIHNEYENLPHKKGLPEGHAPVIRELVVPVFRNEQIVAVLGVGNKGANYDESDKEIVSKFADLAWDIAQRKLSEENLFKLTQIQQTITLFATEFVNIPLNKIDEIINEAIAKVGKLFNVDHVYMFEFNFNENYAKNTYEWCGEGNKSQIGKLQKVRFDVLKDWIKNYYENKTIVVNDVNTISGKIPLKSILQDQGIKSLIEVPMFIKDQLFGFVGFDSTNEIRFWNDDEAKLLRILAELFSNLFDRRRSQTALTQSEENFRRLIENSPDGIAVFRDLEFIMVNKSALSIFDYSDAFEVINQDPFDFIHPDSIETVEKVLAELNKNEKCENVQLKLLKKNKSVIFCEINAVIYSSGNNKLILATFRDITEKIQREKELEKYRHHLEELVRLRTTRIEEQSQFFKIFMNTLPNPAFVKDLEGNYTEVNDAFLEFFEVKRADIIGKTVENISNKEVSEKANKMDEVLKSGQKNISYETFHIGNDGTRKELLIYKASFSKPNSAPQGITGLVVDITKQKKLNVQLMQSFEREKEVNEIKTNFISMASHEFRTPLTAILASIDIIEMQHNKKIYDKLNTHIGRIQKSVSFMNSLLEEVLILSRTDRGKISFEPILTELKPLLIDLLEQCKTFATPKHNIELNYNAEKPIYVVDPKLTVLIINNLVVNAIKYSPNGGTVSLSVTSGNKELLFTVTDEGMGIEEKDLKNIFEPFYRAADVQNILGSGLGLSIVKNALELHNGTISVVSTKGKGTKFTIRFKEIS